MPGRERQHRHAIAFPSCGTLRERQSPYWHRPGKARRLPLFPLRPGQCGSLQVRRSPHRPAVGESPPSSATPPPPRPIRRLALLSPSAPTFNLPSSKLDVQCSTCVFTPPCPKANRCVPACSTMRSIAGRSVQSVVIILPAPNQRTQCSRLHHCAKYCGQVSGQSYLCP